ncbi:hypothetical protein RHS01_05068 [Rhizoctonia solani]|uniref:CCHC-type domain-containing protein n=1 Tax=Rhizoctonia solani TaxID=456999 RepID=A0A8H7IFM4_9AGAM|nr:hypothetical protein RHS01_05068 [Rhizoctonia solani]
MLVLHQAPLSPTPSLQFHPHALAPLTPTCAPPAAPVDVPFQPIPNHPLAAHLQLRKTCQGWNQSRPLPLSSRLSKPSPPKLGPFRTKSNPKASKSPSFAICQETNNLVGNKDQGRTQTKPGPLTGPVTPPTHLGGETHTPGTVRPGLKAPFWPTRGTRFDSEEEEEPRHPKKEPTGTPKRHLGPSPPLIQGPLGRKATQWLNWMLLWVALHRDQFDEEEQMVVWILYHMTDKAANWALPLIGQLSRRRQSPNTIPTLTAKFKEAFADPDAKQAAARKIATLAQNSTTSKYITEFRNLIAELDWNKGPILRSSCKASTGRSRNCCPPRITFLTNLKPSLRQQSKIDNICRKNEENQPKKAPAKSPATVATTSTTTTQWVRLLEDPNYITPEERDRCRASGLCVKCGQKGHGIKQCPNGWKATIKEVAKVAEEEGLGKE